MIEEKGNIVKKRKAIGRGLTSFLTNYQGRETIFVLITILWLSWYVVLLMKLPSKILLAVNHVINSIEHHNCPFMVMKLEGANFDGQIITTDKVKPDQGLKLDHGIVYELAIKYIKSMGS